MAAAEQVEDAGNTVYHEDHMGAIFKRGFSFSGYERDLLAWNRGDRFLDVSGVSGVDSISDGRGTSFADLDNDGDSDIFLTAQQGKAHYLFRNNVGNERHFLRVEIVGDASGTDAFGTVVRLSGPHGRQAKLKAGGSGYLSQSDPRLLFGLGSATVAGDVEVVWPDGQSQRLGEVPADRTIRVVQGREGYTVSSPPRFSLVDPMTRDEELLARLGFRPGGAFPDLALRDAQGNPATVAGLLRPGRKLLVNLWATWCVPCAKEMPELQRLSGRLAAGGIDVAGLSVDTADSADGIAGYVAERGVTYPVFSVDEAGLDRLYPREEIVVPVTVLLDEHGRVLRLYRGWSSRTADRILALSAG